MNTWGKIGLGSLTLAAAGGAAGVVAQRTAMAKAERAFANLASRSSRAEHRFDTDEIVSLPEIAQRYFRHAIKPGTPHFSSAELTMEGSFLLGDKDRFQSYRMKARQVLLAPDQFVWIPSLRSGAMFITGSDALVDGSAWTRFWLMGIVPVANEQTNPDLVRSAQFRAAVESAIWLPPSLLPGNGVEWEQLGKNEARITFTRFKPALQIELTIDDTGAVKQVVGQRWSNANPAKTFRLQPFGGRILGETTFNGLTVPSQMEVGNHFGTSDYLPFFQATVTGIRYR